MNIREKTEKKVFSYIEDHCMIVPGDKIVLGVSGGADSVCLLFLLLEYAKKVPLTLAVVHVNHGIRWDAGEDALFVEQICTQHNLPFYLTNADVEGLAAREKCSTEDMGRRLRYEAFDRAAKELGGAKIAVAHNSNDNAETMLFHLFRGSGLKGLCGIAPVREESIIRPILCLERREIEEYLTARGLLWRTDSTNEADDYTRNRIRHHILPYAEENIVSGAVAHMSQTASMLREAEEYLEQQTKEALKRCLVDSSEAVYILHCTAFCETPAVLQKRILFTLAKKLSPSGKDISQVHIMDMMTLTKSRGNRSIDLPFGIRARREYEKMILERTGSEKESGDLSGGQEKLKQSDTGDFAEMKVQIEQLSEEKSLIYRLDNSKKLEFSLFFNEKDKEVPQNRYTKWFDYDKILECPVIRFRTIGDYFTISDGSGGSRHKSLKDYMITEKIPKAQRDQIPLIAVGNHVLWLVGYRISEYFKISGNTNRILQVKLLIDGCRSSETEEKNG